MCFSQQRIGAHCLEGRLLGALPRFRRWRLDEPIQQRVAVGEFGPGGGKVWPELHRAFQTFDCLTQSLGAATRGVITARGESCCASSSKVGDVGGGCNCRRQWPR